MAKIGLPLSIRHLTVHAKSGATLLDIPKLDLPAGRSVGIRGPSGAGKSTLLMATLGLAKRVSGQVIWGDQDLYRLGDVKRAAFRRTAAGTIFQDHMLFDELSAPQNANIAALFSPKSMRAQVARQTSATLDQLGISTEHRSAATYSGGEKQRIAVARALAHHPRVLFADEPTASLNRDAGQMVGDTLLAHVRDHGATMVLVSHDERLLARMDQVVTLSFGRIVEPA